MADQEPTQQGHRDEHSDQPVSRRTQTPPPTPIGVTDEIVEEIEETGAEPGGADAPDRERHAGSSRRSRDEQGAVAISLGGIALLILVILLLLIIF